MIRFHTFNYSSECENLGHRGSLRAEAVLVESELEVYDAAYAVEDQSIVDFSNDAYQTDTSVIVGI